MGRFIQADTIVPGAGDSMSYDRYAYVKYNPLKFSDPSGKHPCTPGDPDYNPQSCISYMSDSSSGRIETYNRTTVTMSGRLIGHDQHLTTEVPAELLHPNLENGVDPASNACGAVSGCAAAEALGVMGYSECMNKFAELASSYDYSPSSGIQPSDFAAIMTEILKGVANVDVVQAPSPEEGFNTIANALDRGSQVIVDYVGDNYVGDISVADGKPVIYGDDNTFAHFARVYSITDNKITIVNSIFTTSALTVDSPKSEFSQAWNYPERRAGYGVRNPQKVERVNNWIMIISKP